MFEEINESNVSNVNKANQPFNVIGKILPVFQDGVWSFSECLFENAYEKKYTDDDEHYESYIGSHNKAIYFYYENLECVGQIIMREYWNKYAFIQDLAVAQKSRGKGVGTQLIKKAIEWAKQKNLGGLMLETQDNNLMACRFYHKLGFHIGAVDTMLYANFDNADEKAIFWYMKF